MADMTNVDTGRIKSVVSQMDNLVDGMRADSIKIREAINALDKGWNADSKAKFMSRFRAEEEALVEMLEQYLEIGQVLREAADDFERTENEISSQCGSLAR